MQMTFFINVLEYNYKSTTCRAFIYRQLRPLHLALYIPSTVITKETVIVEERTKIV